jgi:hypothetical protein
MSDELGILLSTLLFAQRDTLFFDTLREEDWFVDVAEVEKMADSKKRFNIKVRRYRKRGETAAPCLMRRMTNDHIEDGGDGWLLFRGHISFAKTCHRNALNILIIMVILR